jgi:DNA-binding NtrC family response regulator
MKTVLIVDESQAVRETLALILGRDFVVIQRPAAARDGRAFSAEKADLLILGISSFSTAEVSNLSEIASQVPFPVLFLVESKQAIEPGSDGRNFDYLVKPFNPYDLKAKIVRLLNRPRPRPEAVAPAQGKATNAAHLEFPYLPPSTSVLAKRFALSGLPVLILAEVGCGQERVARAMRSLNGRAGPGIAAFLPRFSKELLVEQMAQV